MRKLRLEEFGCFNRIRCSKRMRILSQVVIVCMLVVVSQTADVINVEDMTLNTRSFSLYSTNSRSLKNVLRLPNDVDLLKTTAVKTAQGVEKSRLKELYRGKTVVGAGVEARIDSFGNYIDGAVTGTLVVNIEKDLPPESSCTLTPSEAVAIVLQTEGLPLNIPITEQNVVDTIFLDDRNVAHRAYEIDLFILIRERHPFYTIDKCTRIILDNFNKMIRFTIPPSVVNFSAGTPPGTTSQTSSQSSPPSSSASPPSQSTSSSSSPSSSQPSTPPPQFGVTTGQPGSSPPALEQNPSNVDINAVDPTTTNSPNPQNTGTQSAPFPGPAGTTSRSRLNTYNPSPAPSTLPPTQNPFLTSTNTNAPQPITQPPTASSDTPTSTPSTTPKTITQSPTSSQPPQPDTDQPAADTTASGTWTTGGEPKSRSPRWTDPWLTSTVTSTQAKSQSWPWTTASPTWSPNQAGCPTSAVGIGGNTKTQQYSYGVPPRCLNPTVSGDLCLLENEFVKVVDLQGARYVFNPPTANFTCVEGYPDSVNGAFSPALDAYFFATIAGKVLKDWYGHTQDLKPMVQVHYGKNVDNAFYNPNSNVLTFGDGNWLTYPLVSLDVVSHELAHGITTQHSNLRYKGESGGIDESFSDMAGEVAEAYFAENDWLVGADLVKTDGAAFRYFADPSQDGNSINHVSMYKWNMDVHFSSGIYNTVFYRMVTKYNIDIRYAYEAFLKANLLYWKSTDGFTKAACGAVRGAYDTGIDVTDVIAAFDEVGITACSVDNFIEKLDPAVPRTDLSVSSEVQPLFRFSVPDTYSGVLFTAWALENQAVGIALASSLSRSQPPIQTSYESLTYNLPQNATRQMYVRLYSDSPKVTTKVSLSIQFI